MNWVSFLTGGMTVILAYAMFTGGQEEELEIETCSNESMTNVVVHNGSGRFVTLSCQTCRKLKKHRELVTNVFQCTKCKRYVDLR